MVGGFSFEVSWGVFICDARPLFFGPDCDADCGVNAWGISFLSRWIQRFFVGESDADIDGRGAGAEAAEVFEARVGVGEKGAEGEANEKCGSD